MQYACEAHGYLGPTLVSTLALIPPHPFFPPTSRIFYLPSLHGLRVLDQTTSLFIPSRVSILSLPSDPENCFGPQFRRSLENYGLTLHISVRRNCPTSLSVGRRVVPWIVSQKFSILNIDVALPHSCLGTWSCQVREKSPPVETASTCSKLSFDFVSPLSRNPCWTNPN